MQRTENSEAAVLRPPFPWTNARRASERDRGHIASERGSGKQPLRSRVFCGKNEAADAFFRIARKGKEAAEKMRLLD